MVALSIALTGGIASGKSTAARLLGEFGATIIDSDLLAREVVAPGTAGLDAIVARFGRAVLASDGSLDRQALGEIVFADDQARSELNAITHPAVRARRSELMAAAAPDAIVISVIPLLAETGMADEFDAVIVVDVPVEQQIARLRARNGFTADEALARIAAQADRAERLAVATWVVDNSGTREQLATQLSAVWDAIEARPCATPSSSD